ncbi:hypothetical protein Tco_0550732 [Tanacetum coccineum]
MILLRLRSGEVTLLWFQEMVDDDFGESGIWHVLTLIEKGECSISSGNICEVFTLISWSLIKDCPKDFSIDKLLHKDFWDIYRYGESLKTRGILDYLNDHLKCLFLLWYSGFQSDIGRADLDSLSRRNLLFITSNNLLCFLRIYDSA